MFRYVTLCRELYKFFMGKRNPTSFNVFCYYSSMIDNFFLFALLRFDNRPSRATMTQLLFSLNGSSSIIFVTGSSCGVIRKFVVLEIFSSIMPRLLAVCFSLEIRQG